MDYTQRRATITEMRHSGATLQKIGDLFGITRERVRQIVTYPIKKIKERTLEASFLARVDKEVSAPCWIWTVRIATGGVPTMYVGSYKRMTALQVSWQIYRGELPDGNLRRTCHNKLCVNPDHLTTKSTVS